MSNLDVNDIDIKEMSEKTGLNIFMVAEELGVPFSEIGEIISTKKEAKDAYQSINSSEADKYILPIWNDFSFKEIENVSNEKEARTAFFDAPSGTLEISFEKWVEFTSTARECKGAYVNSARFSSARFSEIRENVLLPKWKKLSLNEVRDALTVEEAKEAYDDTPDDREIKEVALLKCIELTSTFREISVAYHNAVEYGSKHSKVAFVKVIYLASTVKECSEAYHYNHRFISADLKELALKKWHKLSLQEVKDALTVEEIKEAYCNTPYDEYAEKSTTDKRTIFSIVFGGKKLDDSTPDYGEARRIAFVKWEKLSLQKVECVSTEEEALEAYHGSSHEGETRKRALLKLASFFKKNNEVCV